jgi:acetyltransferase-like isoleucine patch superfamily enzyme
LTPDKGIVPDDGVPTGRHHSARVGGAPEHRSWRKGQRVLEPFIHPTARISAFCSVDGGMYVATKIGARSWMLQHSHVGHDAIVGMDVEICTGAVIGGHCILLDGCKIGLNATVLPKVRIGRGARVGAGAVVTKNVPDGEVWAGNPARRLEKQDLDRVIIVGGDETTVGELLSRPLRREEARLALEEKRLAGAIAYRSGAGTVGAVGIY